MFRPAYRAATIAKAIPKAPSGKRYASTAASRSGTWKGAAVRWGLAGAIIYYYNTSIAFAEEPQSYAPQESSRKSETYATIDSIAEQRRAQARTRSQSPQEDGSAATVAAPDSAPVTSGALEEEAEQQGAFNEETGEINWDCPCLGGMANGPCGEQFRAAFSCFVYSKEEPKGVDCIEHFKTMQNCFREHPDVYGSELEDNEVPPEAAEGTPSVADAATPAPTPSAPLVDDSALRETVAATDAQVKSDIKGAVEEVKRNVKEAVIGSDDLVPKAWHDGRESTTEK